MSKQYKNVNWKNLTPLERKSLSDKLEKEAVLFDMKLDRFMYNTKEDTSKAVQIKLEKLWGVAATLWGRIRSLEKWRHTHGE